VRLQAIDDSSHGDAVELLSRGFPERTPAFWEASLKRLAAYRRETNGRPIGQMMKVNGKPVGVILTIESKRRDGAQARGVVNLSSWYIDEEHRWLAARMLSRVIADDSVLYVDLSPSAETMKLNERLGFQTAARGVVLFFLPWTAVTGRAQGEMISYERLPAGALEGDDAVLLGHHRDLGCIAAALRTADGYHPLLFHAVRRKGLPVARSILAPSRQLIVDHIGSISRFLLRRGVPFLSLNGEAATGGIPWNRSASVQVKGRWEEGDRLDHTYSEIVFLSV
jgi:hypothetical protein